MTNSQFPEDAKKKLEEYLATHELPSGLGSKESACSVAAINLALTGELTDRIPDCMSYVIGRWIIHIQDRMPSEIRNSKEWKSLLPLAAGTGRTHESERRSVIVEWMWEVVFPDVLPFADKHGFGDEWRTMCEKRDYQSAILARDKARVIREELWNKYYSLKTDAAAADADADADADVAAAAADAVAAAADDVAAADVAAADVAAAAAADAVAAAADVAAADVAVAVAARMERWKRYDPSAVLKRLIEVASQEL